MVVAWRLAPALETLRKQVNEQYPGRSKVSDGTVGDLAHAARPSDHNPNKAGIVCAWDVTHDLDQKGDDFDAWKFAETLRLNRDPRIGYVISNGRICSGNAGPQPWTWRPYTGSNKHAQHTHISVRQDPLVWNDAKPWNIGLPSGAAVLPAPVATPPAGITLAMRRRMATAIISYEARRSADGNLLIFDTPGEGYEVAGITSTNHPKDAKALADLVRARRFQEAETYAADWILKFTAAATGWTTDAGLEFMLRDCIHHRGSGGAARILQLALGLRGYGPGQADGEVGQRTRDLLAKETPSTLIPKFRQAREFYERNPEPGRNWKRDETSNQWKGLVNRWTKAERDALKFQKEGQQPSGGATAKNVTTGTIGTGTVGVAVGVSKKSEAEGGGFDWGLMIPILVVGLSFATVAWFVWPKAEGKTA